MSDTSSSTSTDGSSTVNSGGSSTQPTVEKVRLAVRSIGTAPFRVVGAIKQICTLTEHQIAERLFRAPAELFSGLAPMTAERMADVLRGAGLEVDVLAADATFTPGEGGYDVALVVNDFSRMMDVAREVMSFLGVDAKTARG